MMRAVPLLPGAFGYDAAVLIVLSLSSFAVASYINDRWLRLGRSRFHVVYAATLGCVICLGISVQDPAQWFRGNGWTWLAAVIVGPVLGIGARRCDVGIVRAIERRRLRRRLAAPRNVDLFAPPASMPRPGDRARTVGPGQAPSQARVAAAPLLALIGGLEEVVYRAILTGFCLALRDPIAVGLALAGTVAAFALSHIEYGWSNVLAKLPLGIGALAVTLVLGNVAGAILMHAVYNILGQNASVLAPFNLRAGMRAVRPYRGADRGA